MHVGLLRSLNPTQHDRHSRDPDFYDQGWSATPQASKQQGLRVCSFLILDQRIGDGRHEGCELIKTTCGVRAPSPQELRLYYRLQTPQCTKSRMRSDPFWEPCIVGTSLGSWLVGNAVKVTFFGVGTYLDINYPLVWLWGEAERVLGPWISREERIDNAWILQLSCSCAKR